MSRRCERRHDGVAEVDALAILERDVRELNPCVCGHVCRCASPFDERRKARDVIGLNMRLEDGDDRRTRTLTGFEVAVDEVDVWIDDSQRRLRHAPE
jgi:hypothetical protein